MKQVEARRAKEAERQAALKQEAIDFKTALSTIGRFTVKKQTGEDNVLFGTVTNGDVAEAIEAATRRRSIAATSWCPNPPHRQIHCHGETAQRSDAEINWSGQLLIPVKWPSNGSSEPECDPFP